MSSSFTYRASISCRSTLGFLLLSKLVKYEERVRLPRRTRSRQLSRLGRTQFPRSVTHNLTADDHGLGVGCQRVAVREQLPLRDELVGVVQEHRQGVQPGLQSLELLALSWSQ